MRVRERDVRVGTLDVHLAEAGEGRGRPSVVLLHGFPDSWQLWRHQLEQLSQAGFHVVAPDLRGFGRTSAPTGTSSYRLRLLRGDVLGLMDVLGVGSAAVVGHDWGSLLAWSLAERAPARVTRLVAVSVGHPRAVAAAGPRQWLRSWYVALFCVPVLAERVLPLAGWRGYRRAAWHGARHGDDADADRQVADLSRPGRLTAGLAWYRANLRPAWPRRRRRCGASERTTGRTSRITCPVLGVWSSGDVALTERQMVDSRRHVAGPWRYERLDGVDHWVPVHAPERLGALLLDFLGEPQSGA